MKKWLTTNNLSITKLLGMRSNVFLVSDGNLNIMVDTSPSFFRNILERRLKSQKIDHIDYLVLTHTHFDHVGNAHWIKENYQARVIVHRSEAPYLEKGESPLPEGTNFFTRPLMRHYGQIATSKMRFEPCPADILADSRLDLKPFGIRAYLLHTPGHSMGSISLIIDDEIAAVGDAMVGTLPGKIYPPFADDVPELIRSWEILLNTGCGTFLPAHGSAKRRQLVEGESWKRDKGRGDKETWGQRY